MLNPILTKFKNCRPDDGSWGSSEARPRRVPLGLHCTALAVAALLSSSPIRAQDPEASDTGAETAAQTQLDAPVLDSAPTDASVEKNALPFVRIATGGGVGWAQEKVMRHTARVSHARLSVDYVRVPGLVLGLDAELQNQERAYATTLPALNEPGRLELRENETRLRIGLAGGWDALGSWVAYQDRRLGVLPRLVVSLDQFDNDVVPHTSLGLGAGVSGFVRLAERLRLQTQCTYQYALEIGDKVVQQRLMYGLPISAFRYDAGVVLEVAPRAGLSLGYAGEWLTQEHSDRFANSLLLGLILDT